MTAEQLKHLEFIQHVITRMNTNSFQIKSWAVTLVSALLAIYASTRNTYFILAAIFPSIILWCLDSYYLMQERKFRGLYDDVAGISKQPKSATTFAMCTDLYTGGKYSYLRCFMSTTVATLYLAISGSLVILFIYLQCR
jgi:hypothetical protein